MMNIENIEETALLTVERQDFDSDIFGRPVYRLKIRGGGKGLAEALSDLVRAWVGKDIALCVCRIPAADTDSALALEAAGFRRIECLVTLTCDLAAWRIPITGVDLAWPADLGACIAIARSAFSLDRLHTDPFIPNEIADRQKEAWVRSGLAGGADRSFVVREAGMPVGFLLCRIVAGAAVADLLAVAPAHRRQGHGRRLMEAALAHYAGGYPSLRVATQDSNRDAISVYRRLGFRESGAQLTYHFTPPPG
jgi:ribosomal protein S18 acetylase RimI-like enzyme